MDPNQSFTWVTTVSSQQSRSLEEIAKVVLLASRIGSLNSTEGWDGSTCWLPASHNIIIYIFCGLCAFIDPQCMDSYSRVQNPDGPFCCFSHASLRYTLRGESLCISVEWPWSSYTYQLDMAMDTPTPKLLFGTVTQRFRIFNILTVAICGHPLCHCDRSFVRMASRLRAEAT